MKQADIKIGNYYVVVNNISHALINDHLQHGYADKWDFLAALKNILNLWQGRSGECVAERHGFLTLRFHDTPGGKPDEAKIPFYLLQPTAPPPPPEPVDEFQQEIDRAFGFD